jgi:hypothetical protein
MRGDHGDMDYGLAHLRPICVIFRQAVVAANPAKGPSDNPPFRQQEETLSLLGALDYVQADVPPGPQSSQPGLKVSGICLIGPNHAQAGDLVAEACQQRHGTTAVLDTSCRDNHSQESPSRLNEDVRLAVLHVFRPIIPVDPLFPWS